MIVFRKCILDPEKTCIECGECNLCDLDPGKICDNCCKCLELSDEDFETIPIDHIEFE